ncbi:MAG TPA: PAS domain S-box protein, partial [Prolixibacteraceae bacterium]|nr:PAS domain S-box protein [Prolixibacteraceae bacterium]
INKTDEELANKNRIYPCISSDLKVLESELTSTSEEKLGDRIYETTKFPLQLSGNKRGIGGIIRDITESKISAEIIKNERQLLRTVIDNLPVTIYVKDCEGRKIIANKADLEIIGAASEAEVLGKTDLETFNNEIGKRGFEDDLKVIKTGQPVINREEIFFNKEDEQQWLLTSKIPLHDQKGNITGLVGIGRDITEQKKANETILKFSKSIEQSPSTIVITDVNGNIEYVNPTFTEVTGFTLIEVLGRNPRILKSGQMAPEIYDELWATISSGEVWRGEFLNKKKNGELYWEWATMTSIKNEEGVITNYISIKEDISSRKKMEADLIIAKNKAEENDRLKSAFLANMSHEIRTPLNSIIGFSELLSDPGFESEQRYEFARIITNSGNNLLAIISDIMDISKIEAGQVEIRKNVFSLNRLIQDIHNEYQIKAHMKGIEFQISRDLSPDEILIESDQTKVKQVLVNFVGNALKFTEKGTIEIGARVIGQSVQFFVKDTGIGIPERFHARIFERFRQVEGSYTRKYGGNGLGLAISKSLIEMLGGTIEMQSQEGKGSLFYFTLPDVIK